MIRLTLFSYLASRILWGVLGLCLALSCLIILVEMIESMREVSKIHNAGFTFALQLTLLRAPKTILTLTPFIFLFGTMWAFHQLNTKSEIAVMRSAGVSIWGITLPAITVAFFAGLLMMCAIDPLASYMQNQAQHMKNEIRNKRTNLLNTLEGDIWLRLEENDTAVTLLHAKAYDAKNQLLENVTLWRRTSSGVFIERWDADTAYIRNKRFELQDASRTTLDNPKAAPVQTHTFSSPFTLLDLKAEAIAPDAMSIWKIPSYVQLARKAGLPRRSYELRYHELASLPLKLIAMVMIAATFCLHHQRSGGTAKLLLTGVISGFVLFIVSELASATAEAGLVPVTLAAWSPAIIAIFLASSILLYTEDG